MRPTRSSTECSRRCRPLAEGTDRDHLLSAITRPTDGTVVREQSIRTSVLAPVDGIAADGPVMRREVTVEMTGTFDSVFEILPQAGFRGTADDAGLVRVLIQEGNFPLQDAGQNDGVELAVVAGLGGLDDRDNPRA